MKSILSIAMLASVSLLLSGCLGYSSVDNEMIGQVKKVNTNTPIFCGNFNDADISLGVMRNGVGSMSAQDMWVYVPNTDNYTVLKKAADTGQLVKIKYKNMRAAFCTEEVEVISVELVN